MLMRWTCRLRVHGDPRPALRAAGRPYVYSILHANQIAAAINTEPNTAAMVSQSGDGELLVQAFRALGVTAIRGSSQHAGTSRGGAAAVDTLVEHVRNVGPAIIAVDGPRGPRGHVRKGIASLAIRSDAAVLNVVLVPRWKLTIAGAWDRFQVPLPLSRVDAYFAEPILPNGGEGVEELRKRIEASLLELEQRCDPRQASPPQLRTPAPANPEGPPLVAAGDTPRGKAAWATSAPAH